MSTEKPDKENTPPSTQHSGNRTLYYHRYMAGGSPASSSPGVSPAPYHGSTGGLAYGGGQAYGGMPYGSVYYGGGGQSGGGGAQADDSLVGTLNLARILRVCMQHWMTIFVFLVLGALGAFIVFQLMPVKYRAVSMFEMSIRPRPVVATQQIVGTDEGSLKDVFNTRVARLRSPEVFKGIIELYRTEHATSTVPDNEIVDVLAEAEMELQPFSRLITLTVVSGTPELSRDLSNAYALACEKFMHKINQTAAENAVAHLTTALENQERILQNKEDELLEARQSRQLDIMKRTRAEKDTRMAALNSQIVNLDASIMRAKEMVRVISAIQDAPDKFATLPEAIPRASEISGTFSKMQEVSSATRMLLIKFTETHPDVIMKKREEEVYQNQFKDAVMRANETAKAELAVLENQRTPLIAEITTLKTDLGKLDSDIISSEMIIAQLERTCQAVRDDVSALNRRKTQAELSADENAAIIQQVRAATLPQKPVSPKAIIIFPAGVVLGLIFGVFFVLLLDHMEDKLIGVPDIEQRLRLKALAVFPHLRRKQRNQVALTTHTEPFSQYAESMAGLRNLLDSPRYHDLTKVILVMSTQPAEGKTCTATNLAIAYAQSGQRTLLVDFDMRRPRLAGIFQKPSESFQSLPHTLAKNKPELFDTLPVKTEIPSMDVVFSRASSRISPSVLMGTNIITEFFDWARSNYDRIIIDSPPFGLVGDVIVLANLVDSVLLVATPDKTRFGPIHFASRRLAEVGARLLGVVVNNVDFGRWGSFSKYEVRYGYGYNRYGYTSTASKDDAAEIEDAQFAVDAHAEEMRERMEAENQPEKPVDKAFISDDE